MDASKEDKKSCENSKTEEEKCENGKKS